MKTVKVWYEVRGHHQATIEVDDDMTQEEIEDMCYREFPQIEEYTVEVEMPEEDEDEDDDDSDWNEDLWDEDEDEDE